MTTGERIKGLRQELGMSQAELGEKIGVKTPAIYKYENGLVVNLKRSTIEKLATALNVSPSYLMGFDGEERPTPVSESGPSDPVTVQIMEIICQMSPEEKRLYLENLRTLRLLQEQGRKPDIQE